MGNALGARKNAKFKAVSAAPSINQTPAGSAMVPVAYPVISDLSDSMGTVSNVKFNGDPAYVLDQSTQPSCKGDNPGTGKGVKSGTLDGEVKPAKGSSTVRAGKKAVVRHGDRCTMQGGNCHGTYVTVPAPSGGMAACHPTQPTNPPIKPETPKEKSAFKKWWEKTRHEMAEAVRHPIDGVIGAGKGLANIVPQTVELLQRQQLLDQAEDAEMTAGLLGAFGDQKSADTLTAVATQTRSDAQNLDLPKFEMANEAQEGGDKISTAIQLAMAGAGLAKGAVRGLAKGGAAATEAARTAAAAEESAKVVAATEEGAKAVSVGEDVAKTAAEAGKAAKIEKAAAEASNANPLSGKDGVKISKNATNAEKGVFGEKQAEGNMKERNFEKISKDPDPHGIDGVYKNPNPPPDYVIMEAKYGQSQLGKTLDGKQMSDGWINGENTGLDRLEKSVGMNNADAIRESMKQPGSVEKWLLRVDGNGNVTKKILDAAGNVIK